jgi:dTDP-glucose 4,6-dehydratase
LVTGGAGFIGSVVVKNLVLAGHEAVVVDVLTYAGDTLRLAAVEKSINFIRADICDYDLMKSIFTSNKIDVCINLAAHTHVDRSLNQDAPFLQSNINGVQVLLSLLKERLFNSLVQVSTDEVYGEGQADRLFTEADPFNPSSPYAASKASAEFLIQAYRRSFGLDARVIRMCNIYGPFQHPEKLIPRVFTCFMQNIPVTLYGSGCQKREWMYIEDAARAIIMLAIDGKDGDVYNAGSGETIVNHALVQYLAYRLDKPTQLIEFGTDRPGHDFQYGINSSRITEVLGFSPKFNFEQGIEETFVWYKINLPWARSKLIG